MGRTRFSAGARTKNVPGKMPAENWKMMEVQNVKTLGTKTPAVKVMSSRWARLALTLLAAAIISSVCVKAYPWFSAKVFNLTLAGTELHIKLLRLAILFPIWTLVCSWFSFGLSQVGEWLHRNRFRLGAAIILAAVVLNISGSSLAVWNSWLGRNGAQDLVFGAPRPIRTDEYVVGTPLAFSQAYNDYGYFNWLFGDKPADMFIIKDAPVWFPTEIFRPFHWGYLLLGSSAGLAFYWSARLVVLFLSAYQFFLCIGGEKKLVSRSMAALGSSLITFAPLTQWWFAVNGLPEMLIAVFISICCFDYMLQRQETWVRLLCGAVIMQCAGMFIFTLYPAWQIPMGYILLGLIIAIVIRHWGKIRFKPIQIVGLIAVFLVFAALLGMALLKSADTIRAMMSTSYPGSRMSKGGGRSPLLMFSSLATLCLPFKDFYESAMLTGNNVEVSVFIDLCPLGVLFAVMNMVKRRKANFLDCYLIVFLVFMSVFAIVGFPAWLSKLTFMSSVTSSRTTIAIGICNIILLIRCAREWCANHSVKAKAAVAVVYTALAAGIAYMVFRSYLDGSMTVSCAAAGFILAAAVVSCDLKVGKIVATLATLVMAFSGLAVNPVQYSTKPITDQPVAQQVRILQEHKPGVWVTEGDNCARLANLLVANGVKTFNALAVTPDLQGMKRLDPEDKWQHIYNRYAFISINIVDKPAKEPFKLTVSDAYTIDVTPEQLEQLGVTYVLSANDLSKRTFDGYRLVKIGETVSGETPYEVQRIN